MPPTSRWLLPLIAAGLLLQGCDDPTAPIDRVDGWVDVATGRLHACGLRGDGDVYCWGGNFQGQIGDGTLEDRLVPTRVGGGPPFRSLEAAGDRTCGLDDAGTAWCWGDNDQGQVGGGRGGLPAVRPRPVAGGHRFRQLSLSVYLACGLDEGGEAWCWGGDRFRNLLPAGEGYFCPGAYAQLAWVCFDEPVRLQPGLRFQTITVGLFHVCGVTRDGDPVCWGSSRYGELGIGEGAPARCVNEGERSSFDIPCALEPVGVSGGLFFAEMRAGGITSCGLTEEGTAYCWGADRFNNGQLGTGTLNGSWTPQRVLTTRELRSLHPSTENSVRSTTCAIDSGGGGLCWGSNDLGQLGSAGSQPCYRGLACAVRPVEIVGGFAFTALDPSSSYTCGVVSDGGLYCWGANGSGQLGDGTTSDRPEPGSVAFP